MTLLFEQETHLLRRCFFDVQNEVGLGRHEEAYHQACVLWFAQHQVPVVSKMPQRLFVRGDEAHIVIPDFIAWDAICIELKSAPSRLGQIELMQLFNYLKCRDNRVGMLVNMGLDRVDIERVVYDPPETEFVENWNSWTDSIEGADRDTGLAIREALRAIFTEHTTGYGEGVVKKLVHFALRQQGLRVTANPIAKAFFQCVEVHESALDCLVVNDRIVLTLSALVDTNDFNLDCGRSYLKTLGLNWGIAVDFGKRQAQITGFRTQSR